MANANKTNNSAVSVPDVGSALRAEQERIAAQTLRNGTQHERDLARLDRLPEEKGGRK